MKQENEVTIGILIGGMGLILMCWHISAILLCVLGLLLSMCCFTCPIGLPLLALGVWGFSAISPWIAFGIGIPLLILGGLIHAVGAKK